MFRDTFLFDFLFPRRCLGCGRWGRYFCETCLRTIKPLEEQICPVCQKPALSGKTHFRCQTRYSLDGLISIFPYQGAIKKAITKLKYRFVTDLADELIDLAIPCCRQLLVIDCQSFVFLPVPLHPRRQRQRGFNQAELLGRLLAKNFGWRVISEALLRHRYTRPQVELKGRERKQNIKDAFRVNRTSEFMIRDSRLIIFDDVWTTGSTLRECSKVLKKEGAKIVWGLTLAR